MTKKAKPPTIVMTDGKREIIQKLLSEYDIRTAEDIQEALKDLLGGTIKEDIKEILPCNCTIKFCSPATATSPSA